MKRVESVEILSFTEAGDDAGVYDLRYDDAATDPAAILAAVTGVGYGATLAGAPET